MGFQDDERIDADDCTDLADEQSSYAIQQTAGANYTTDSAYHTALPFTSNSIHVGMGVQDDGGVDADDCRVLAPTLPPHLTFGNLWLSPPDNYVPPADSQVYLGYEHLAEDN